MANNGVVGQSNLRRSTFLEQSIQGLKQIIGLAAAGYGKTPVPVIVVPNTWSQRELAEEHGEVTYPYLALTLVRLARNTESYNLNLRRGGIAVAKPDSNLVTIYRLIPVIVNFRVRYLTQSNNEMLEFAQNWLMRQKDTQFMQVTDNFRVKVRVKLNEDLSLPEQENTPYGNIFTFDTDCDMMSYIGETETQQKITKIVMTTNLWSAAKKAVVDTHQLPPIELNNTPQNPPADTDTTEGGLVNIL